MEMIDISGKNTVQRMAIARGAIRLNGKTIEAIRTGSIKKGDVLCAAEIAGINAVKTTPYAVPLCHPIPITYAGFDFVVSDNKIACTCTVKAEYTTGVEMEALHGVSVALLTIWDMVKYMEKDEHGQYPDTLIEDIGIVSKRKD